MYFGIGFEIFQGNQAILLWDKDVRETAAGLAVHKVSKAILDSSTTPHPKEVHVALTRARF